MKEAGFVITEMIMDKDSSVNAIFCKYFPEGTITHCAKTMHRDLQQVKQVKCEVRRLAIHIIMQTQSPLCCSARQMDSDVKEWEKPSLAAAKQH